MPKDTSSASPTKPAIKIAVASDKIILALEERGFFAGIMKDGSTSKKEARQIPDFLEITKQASVAWIDYVVDDLKTEAPAIAQQLGFSETLINNLLKSKRSGYEDFDSEMGIMMPAILVEAFEVKLDPLMILIRPDLVVTLHTTELRRFFRLRRYAETFLRKIKPSLPQKDKITLVIIRILDENNSRNFDHLREIEENADKVSESLADPQTPREVIGPQIHAMKHALITYLSGLWATVDVLNALRYGDPELLSDDPKILTRMEVLTREVHTQVGLAEHLSEVLASGLEVMQSIYNNQLQILNNKLAMLMAYLTILGTAVLVPNTIATALSNPAFQMTPSDAGWYTVLLIISTIVSTAVAYWWVKTRGLLPRKPHE